MKPTEYTSEEADIFKEDDLIEIQIREELENEKKALEKQQRQVDEKLKNIEETIKIKKAQKNFIPKDQFLLREQLDRMEVFIKSLNDLMIVGNSHRAIAKLMRAELANIYSTNIYISKDQSSVDILYDYNKSRIYKKINENNADYERTNKKLREIEIRETEWF